MLTDDELIRRHQVWDERIFLVQALTPAKAPKLAPALLALRNHLLDENTHSHSELLAHSLRNSAITVDTANGLIRRISNAGFMSKSGRYSRKYNKLSKTWEVTDTREYKLIEWPATLEGK